MFTSLICGEIIYSVSIKRKEIDYKPEIESTNSPLIKSLVNLILWLADLELPLAPELIFVFYEIFIQGSNDELRLCIGLFIGIYCNNLLPKGLFIIGTVLY